MGRRVVSPNMMSQRDDDRRARARATAVVASLFIVIGGLTLVSRRPLVPLRAATRWSLELRGARFISASTARLQSSLNDCGPTALADLLELAGFPVPSADSLIHLTATDAEGTTLHNLESAANAAGLRVMSVQWDPTELWMLPVPSLVWVDRRHFVVVARRERGDTVEIHDPAAGRYRIAGEKFARSWTGDALIAVDDLSASRREQSTLDVTPPPAGHAGIQNQRDGGFK